MYEIDKFDREIVDLLMEDGRMSAAEIARRVGEISERAVRYRIERMVSEGVIKVSAIINPKVLGFRVIADVFIEVESSRIEEVAEKLTYLERSWHGLLDRRERYQRPDRRSQQRRSIYLRHRSDGRVPGVRKTTTSLYRSC
jgi:Lrp/AsnC family transcriptional regulator for asnA, asnC and gidA